MHNLFHELQRQDTKKEIDYLMITHNTSCQSPFRVGYLIGHLNAGGSEGQLSELAAGMVDRGHVVEIF